MIESNFGGRHDSKHKLVSIIIVNYNGKDDTLEFLESLKKTDYPNYEIIVVDNASTDDSVEAIRRSFPHVRIVQPGKNSGYGCGLNSGITHSRGEYVVTLVNDMIAPQASWLSEAVRIAESDEKIGMVISVWTSYNDPDILDHSVHLKLGRVSEKILEALGSEFFGFGMIENGQKVGELPEVLEMRYGNGLVRRDAIEKVGLYDRKMFLNYESNDFCYRLRKAGYRVVLATKSRLWHKGGASANKESRYFVQYHFYRNKIRFVLKNYGMFEKIFAMSAELPYFMILMAKYILSGRPELARAMRDAMIWNAVNWRDYTPHARRSRAS